MTDCKFCAMAEEATAINRYGTVYAALDKYPVTGSHWLIIPRRHRADYFTLTERELNDTDEALNDLRAAILCTDPTVTGFNIGWNCGPDAGQTIMHAHAHLIPRRHNDCDTPEGGVRGVIPGKQSYKGTK